MKFQIEEDEQQSVPPPPPGSPPPHLPQPRLKDPDKFIVNQLLYFHYDLRSNEMIVTPAPHLLPMMNGPMAIPPPIIQSNLPPQPVQQIQPPLAPPPSVAVQPPAYPFKVNSSRHHSDAKVSKSSRSSTSSSSSSSSKHYHSSSHKPSLHTTNDTNLIVLSSSPSNA